MKLKQAMRRFMIDHPHFKDDIVGVLSCQPDWDGSYEVEYVVATKNGTHVSTTTNVSAFEFAGWLAGKLFIEATHVL